MNDPFEILGISPSATRSEIRKAWRDIAKTCHPDVGGTTEDMARVNEALRDALALLKQNDFTQSSEPKPKTSQDSSRPQEDRTRRVRQDISSFTFNVLPVESFELLEIVANSSGSILDSDCPYLIEFTLEDIGLNATSAEWCRCELVPEAGGTMVHLTIGGPISSRVPDVESVRDELIRCVNELDPINLVEQKP